MSNVITVNSNMRATALTKVDTTVISYQKLKQKQLYQFSNINVQTAQSTNNTSLRPARVDVLPKNLRPLDEVQCNVHAQTEKIIFNDATVLVSDKSINYLNPQSRFSPVVVQVQDYKPPNIGGGAIGGGLKSIILTAQKNSYVEIVLSFSERKIKSISGLPAEMFFETDSIKGVPQTSGQYPIIITLDNDAVVEGIVNVPHLPRQL